MTKTIDNDLIIHKIEFEGWPDALDWLDPEEIEDDRIATLIAVARKSYDELEELRLDLYDALGIDE